MALNITNISQENINLCPLSVSLKSHLLFSMYNYDAKLRKVKVYWKISKKIKSI